MKLTAQVQLLPDKAQHPVLKETLERCNSACNSVSDYAWRENCFGAFDLHKALYTVVREQFELGAQAAVRVMGKVADGYKLDHVAKRVFKEHGAFPYDDRLLKFFTERRCVSIWTLHGRMTVPFVCGERQFELLAYQHGECDLAYSRGKWYLLATCDIPDPTEDEVDRFLGIDRGVVNIATDSDGAIYQGKAIEDKRAWYVKRRKKLQRTGTKSAKRRLRKLSNRQARYQADVNHCIAKQLVVTAKRTKRGVALEDLKGISLRTRVRREDRAARGNWSFAQLEFFIVYKAHLRGVPVRLVDPAHTSQRCSACGYIEKANRRTQSEFLCVHCGHSAHADINAAINISFLAAVVQPIVSDGSPAKPSFRSGASPRL